MKSALVIGVNHFKIVLITVTLTLKVYTVLVIIIIIPQCTFQLSQHLPKRDKMYKITVLIYLAVRMVNMRLGPLRALK